jgi:hypothetical protein
MNVDQLKKGQELLALIKTTEGAIANLKGIKPKDGYEHIYNLHICEFTDGSGQRANLARNYGNDRLLKVILTELEVQLAELQEKFANL